MDIMTTKRNGGMTRREYRDMLDHLQIGVVEAGKVFGMSKRQAIRYAQGDSKIPTPVAKLVRLTAAQSKTLAPRDKHGAE
jgi:hypothetical protein